MISTSIPFDIPKENPFQNDKFERENTAINLEKIINNTENELVISIDSGWGKGKTTFINMWQQRLENLNEYKVLYFNAWENDDNNDPLLAIIGEMEEKLFSSSKNQKIIKKLKSTGITLLKNAIPFALKTLTHGILDVENFDISKFTADQITDYAGKIGEIELSSYKKEKNAKNAFRKALAEYQQTENKKVILFIDELDRCRPTFAIETLEKIKHLFNVPNYVFILSLDKEQLSHSIKTLYGNNMDSSGYLRRFIDLEYNLPEPQREYYIDSLMNEYNLDIGQLFFFKTAIIKMVTLYNFSLRDIDKLFFYIKLIFPLTEFANEHKIRLDYYNKIYSAIYSFLLVLKIKDSGLFDHFIRRDYDTNKFINDLNLRSIKIDDFSEFILIINTLLRLNINLKDYSINKMSDSYILVEARGSGINFDLRKLVDSDNQFIFIKNIQFISKFSNED